MQDEVVSLELQWECLLAKNFNVLTVGKIFRLPENCLVVGGEDGMITVFEIPSAKMKYSEKISLKEIVQLETKGGPVQTLCLHDVTKFNSVDLIVGDSKGTLTFFGNKQILYKMAVSQGCISAVEIDVDAARNLTIIVGDNEGNVFGCLPHCVQWRLRLDDLIKTNNKDSANVVSLLSMRLPISSTMVSNYVIVANSNGGLHVLQNGTVVRSLEMPSVVNTMCSGYFLENLDTPVNTPLSPHGTNKPMVTHRVQVALGMKDGRIFIMNNFNLYLYANVKLPLTKLLACPLLIGESGKMLDIILCCGYFNSVLIYHKGDMVQKVTTNDWVNSITLTPAPLSDGQQNEVILGTLDGCVQAYTINKICDK